MIKSSKEFRKLVVETEDAFKRGSLNGAFVVLDEIKQSIKSPVREVKLCTLIERVIKNRSGTLRFEDTSKLKQNLKMRLKLIEQQNKNQIRKQEEAPEALAVDGAESSHAVKKILRCDHHIHADLIIKAGEQVEVIEKYPADSLVSHPKCKGFFAWNDQLEDLNSRRGGLREQLRNARKMQQEEAPEALAVDGAESSHIGLGLAVKGVKCFDVKLCEMCKTGILTEQGDCHECNAMLLELP
ncbi:hypothetical protein KX909_000306 [Vibrio vulnificus]|nr:hypothetical protein [Vibrio vulnificus]